MIARHHPDTAHPADGAHKTPLHGLAVEQITSEVPPFVAAILPALALLIVFAAVLNAEPAAEPRSDLWVTDGPVMALGHARNHIYATGAFWHAGEQDASNFAWFQSQLGTALPNAPRFNGAICAMISDGADGWYVGGDFTEAAGLPRGRLAHVTASGGLDQSWEPAGVDGPVYAALLDAGTLYIAGDFAQVDGVTRERIAALDAATGALRVGFSADVDGPVHALARWGASLFAGGQFTKANGASCENLAAFDAATGVSVPGWSAGVSGHTTQEPCVRALVVYSPPAGGASLFVGGYFNRANGAPRYGYAAFNPSTGALDSFDRIAMAGTIHAMGVDGNTLYAAGNVGGADIDQGMGFILDTANANQVQPFPRIQGYIHAVEADGSGGWYVGGEFEFIGDTPSSKLVHILASGALDTAWQAGVEGTVNSLWLDDNGGRLYASGVFPQSGGQPAICFAALDPATGASVNWHVDCDFPPACIAIDAPANTLYLGGYFTMAGGAPREALAAVDLATGAVLPWNPALTGTDWQAGATNLTINPSIYSMQVAGGKLYVGGTFSAINGAARHGIGAFDTASGTLAAFNPDLTRPLGASSDVAGTCVDMTIDGTTMYICGQFAKVGGQTRGTLAALDLTTDTNNLIGAWNPGVDTYSQCDRIVKDGARLYAAGSFAMIGTTRGWSGLHAFDATTGAFAASWQPQMKGTIGDFAAQGSRIYAGFLSVQSQDHVSSGIVAIDLNTHTPKNWSTAPVICDAIAVGPEDVYVTGAYGTSGFRRDTGNIWPWGAPMPNALTFTGGRAIGVYDTTVAVGGVFTAFQGAQVPGQIALKTGNGGGLATWALPADIAAAGAINGFGFAASENGDTLYMSLQCGYPSWNPAWDTQENILFAQNTATDGERWRITADALIRGLHLDGDTLYVWGAFTAIGGDNRVGVAALDATTGAVLPWNPGIDAASDPAHVTGGIATSDSAVFISGEFSTAGGVSRPGLAAVDKASGALLPWNPQLTDAGSGIAIGNIALDSEVNMLYFVIAGAAGVGATVNVGGQARACVACVDAVSGAVQPWNPNPDGVVRHIACAGQIVYLGGKFTHVGGAARNALAAIEAAGNGATGAAHGWDPGAGARAYSPLLPPFEVFAMLLAGDGTLYVGGNFPSCGGMYGQSLAAFKDAGMSREHQSTPGPSNPRIPGFGSGGGGCSLAAASDWLLAGVLLLLTAFALGMGASLRRVTPSRKQMGCDPLPAEHQHAAASLRGKGKGASAKRHPARGNAPDRMNNVCAAQRAPFPKMNMWRARGLQRRHWNAGASITPLESPRIAEWRSGWRAW